MKKQQKGVCDFTIKEFLALPTRPWNKDIGPFDSLVILPTRRIHDSGYRCMDFVAVRDGIPLCRLSGCSDVIHIDGIGGVSRDKEFFKYVEPRPWSIDCLKKSGLLQLFCFGYDLSAGLALSSFELFAGKKGK